MRRVLVRKIGSNDRRDRHRQHGRTHRLVTVVTQLTVAYRPSPHYSTGGIPTLTSRDPTMTPRVACTRGRVSPFFPVLTLYLGQRPSRSSRRQ